MTEHNKYLGTIMKDLVKAFWDERGNGARYRVPLVGVDYFKKKYGKRLEKDDWRSAVEAVLEVLKEEEIIADGSFNGKDKVVEVTFKSCIHRETDRELYGDDISVICCPCANVV